MDLREKKTLRAIHNAFLELRGQKPLERIRVKELVELAEISKGTFYLHYKDIYDLSEKLQKEVVENVMNEIKHPDAILNNKSLFTQELSNAFLANINMINILFADYQNSVLPYQIEKNIREKLKHYQADFEADPFKNVSITYQVYGGYFAFQNHYKQMGTEKVIDSISRISGKLADIQ
ncbi:MAG: TetR/AcrR family transcriptional regulator [Eubacteriales bacterium]|nr:TetR/AcrR family transcriptional regulator [Eubacteriales bacterium]